VKGLVARGGVTVSIEWNEEKSTVGLCSATDQTVEFSVNGGEKQVVDLKAGKLQTISNLWKK
jgi:hypothetical protein